MQYILTPPRQFNSIIELPPSKSVSNRALLIHALSGEKTMLTNIAQCDDTQVLLDALQHMPYHIDIKASGSAMRFLTAYLSITEGEYIISGTKHMKHRPIGALVDALRYIGADIEYMEDEGFPPLRIRGKHLDGGRVEVPGNISSQFISALAMIGPVLKNGLHIKLTGSISSRPYIELTLWVMQQFGAEVEWSDIDAITVHPKPYQANAYHVESDWSAASYWYEILALSTHGDNTFLLKGLLDGSKQGDSVSRYLFSLLGVKTEIDTEEIVSASAIRIARSMRHLPRLEYNFVNCPDLVQTFVVCCALLGIPFLFTGVSSLLIKETNRIGALKTEMRKLGYVIKDNHKDELLWDGEKCPATFAPIDTYDDHRMAMAFAPAAIKFSGLRINHPEVVSKSYPTFWNDLRKVGFKIEEVTQI